MSRSGATACLGALALFLALGASASAATKTVTMGLPSGPQKTFNEQYQTDVNDFLPHRVTIRVGDSVRFVPHGFHTVQIPPRGGGVIPLFAPTGQPVTDATDAAGSPFWFNGQPRIGFTPSLLQSAFGKTVRYAGAGRVESGIPIEDRPQPFVVRFTRAGTYKYFCDVHPGMKGFVVVRPKGRAIPSARADARRVRAEVARDLRITQRLRSVQPPAGTVNVGQAGPFGVEYLGMLPETIEVPVGGTVRFQMTRGSFEAHTATFGPGNPESEPDSYLGRIAASFESPTLDPAAVYPSDPPGSSPAVTPATHGNGFWNSGVIDTASASPPPDNASVQFATPGTYVYYCLIHPFMRGTVVVR
jgi:plastocyanin